MSKFESSQISKTILCENESQHISSRCRLGTGSVHTPSRYLVPRMLQIVCFQSLLGFALRGTHFSNFCFRDVSFWACCFLSHVLVALWWLTRFIEACPCDDFISLQRQFQHIGSVCEFTWFDRSATTQIVSQFFDPIRHLADHAQDCVQLGLILSRSVVNRVQDARDIQRCSVTCCFLAKVLGARIGWSKFMNRR